MNDENTYRVARVWLRCGGSRQSRALAINMEIIPTQAASRTMDAVIYLPDGSVLTRMLHISQSRRPDGTHRSVLTLVIDGRIRGVIRADLSHLSTHVVTLMIPIGEHSREEIESAYDLGAVNRDKILILQYV